MRILITGIAGFIGYHLAKQLAIQGATILGIDNLNNYYEPSLKLARLRQLGISGVESDFDHVKKHHSTIYPALHFQKLDLIDREQLNSIFRDNEFDAVVHLAAQAGVRYSLVNPDAYIQSNLIAFFNIIENMKTKPDAHFVFASSSSVYGSTEKVPFSVEDKTDRPMSLYAATKKSNELLAYSYFNLYSLRCTGLRFFTVYGPWGRPDMGVFLFTKKILEEKEIDVYNYGEMKRDFTYVDDIVSGIIGVLHNPPKTKSFFEIFNLENNTPEKLLDLISILERKLGKKAKKNMLPIQPGDVPETFADISESKKRLGFNPKTKIEEGIEAFVNWYVSYYDPSGVQK